jgi:ribonuclease III
MVTKGKIEKLLNIKINNIDLYHEAFVHKSYLNENRKYKYKDNERLEFLGDAVLELVITNFLFHKLPKSQEGKLTSLRSALVRKENLAQISKKLDLGNLLLLSKGENASGGRDKPYLLANVMEALIGAIYLDQGFKIAEKFIVDNIVPSYSDIVKTQKYIDAKSRLQELSQDQFGHTPIYHVIKEDGPDHDKVFITGVKVGENEMGQGNGKSKQQSEQSAALNALQKLLK